MLQESTQKWKIENAEHYKAQQKEYRAERYKNNPEFYKLSWKIWYVNNPEKAKILNNRKTILYKKMVEILTKNNSPLLKKHTADELYADLVGDCNILFCILDAELNEYIYSHKIGTFYYRRNFYAFAEV